MTTGQKSFGLSTFGQWPANKIQKEIRLTVLLKVLFYFLCCHFDIVFASLHSWITDLLLLCPWALNGIASTFEWLDW